MKGDMNHLTIDKFWLESAQAVLLLKILLFVSASKSIVTEPADPIFAKSALIKKILTMH